MRLLFSKVEAIACYLCDASAASLIYLVLSLCLRVFPKHFNAFHVVLQDAIKKHFTITTRVTAVCISFDKAQKQHSVLLLWNP